MKNAVFTKSIAVLPAFLALIFASASFVFGGSAQAAKTTTTVKAAKQDDNSCAGKINRAKIIEWLSSDDTSQAQIINLVKQCGVDFALTESSRTELTKAGARAGLLDTIAENYRPASVDKPPTPAPPIPEKPTPAAPTPGGEKPPPFALPTPSSEKPKPVAPPTISAPPVGKPGAPTGIKETAPPIVKETTPPTTLASAPGSVGDDAADKYPMPNYSGLPVNKAGLIKVLRGATFNSKEVLKIVEESGVSFPMTLATEKDLFQAAQRQGKRLYNDDEWQEIIAAAWENYRSEKTDNPNLVKAIRLYQTSKGANLAEKISIKTTALDLFKQQETQVPPSAQMLYFIAEAYHELASLKYQQAYGGQYMPSDKQAAEVNQLFDGAIAYHKKNVEANPGYVDSWEKLAELYGRLKKYEESIAAYKKLAEFAPKELSYWVTIGDYYVKLGDNKSALAAKKRALLLVKGRDLQLNKDIAELEKKVAAGQ